MKYTILRYFIIFTYVKVKLHKIDISSEITPNKSTYKTLFYICKLE